MAIVAMGSDMHHGDALDLLMADHGRVRELLVEYEDQDDSAYAHRRRREIVDEVCDALERHFSEEEQVLYPALEENADGDGAKLVAAAREAHAMLNVLLDQVRRVNPDSWRFDATFEALVEGVEGHIEDEETELFRYAKERLGHTTLALGRVMGERLG